MIRKRRTKHTGKENNLYALRDVKSDLINQVIVEYAIEFYSELNLLIGKYSEDVITGILPHIICVLNRLDAFIKVNQDLTNITRDNNIEIKNLQCNIIKEISFRYEIYDSSFSNEEAYTKKIFNLNEKMNSFRIIIRRLSLIFLKSIRSWRDRSTWKICFRRK